MTSAAISLAASLIRRFEGCSFAPYADAGGNWTVGWGFRFDAHGKPVTAETPCLTQAQADALLADHLAALAADAGTMLPTGTTDNEAAALLDFAWNLGAGALRRSTLLRLFREGDRAGAAEQFGAWVYAGGRKLPGLVTRRAAERALFVGSSSNSNPDSSSNSSSTRVLEHPPPVSASGGCVFHDLGRPCQTPGCAVCVTADDLNAAELARINRT